MGNSDITVVLGALSTAVFIIILVEYFVVWKRYLKKTIQRAQGFDKAVALTHGRASFNQIIKSYTLDHTGGITTEHALDIIALHNADKTAEDLASKDKPDVAYMPGAEPTVNLAALESYYVHHDKVTAEEARRRVLDLERAEHVALQKILTANRPNRPPSA